MENKTSADTYDSDFTLEEIEKQSNEHFKVLEEYSEEKEKEIKKALDWATACLEIEECYRDTFEDTCGTGDTTDEEREKLYNALDDNIAMIKTIKMALEKQLGLKVNNLNYEPLHVVGWRHECPNCKRAVGENIYHPDVTSDEKYCVSCGQKLDWK